MYRALFHALHPGRQALVDVVDPLLLEKLGDICLNKPLTMIPCCHSHHWFLAIIYRSRTLSDGADGMSGEYNVSIAVADSLREPEEIEKDKVVGDLKKRFLCESILVCEVWSHSNAVDYRSQHRLMTLNVATT